ncbi:MAG: DUF3370 domain-containing protein [Cyanobacteria bacterium J06659_2]
MLAWLSALMLAQTAPEAVLSQNGEFPRILPPEAPQEVIRNQPVRPLPGQLDSVPVLNSNSPEVVETPGILLSTFPPGNTAYPTAHLDYPFEGRFDVFAHHIARATSPNDLATLYLGILVHNPTDRPVTIDILQGASYSTQPEAPFAALPDAVAFYSLPIYAGPGSRVSLDVLQQQREETFPAQVIIPAGQSRMIANEPIAVRTLASPINGRTLLMRLRSSGQVYVASMAQYAPMTWYGVERPPNLQDWELLLANGNLAGPRDRAPTPPDMENGQLIYGRVSGVSIGSRWTGTVTDPDSDQLILPNPGEIVSYGINTLNAVTLGTGQIQTAPLAVRYPDTAYAAHGNYGVQYSLELPLHNASDSPQRVSVYLETPLKNPETVTDQLRFLNPPPDRIFFRGTVQVRYRNAQDEDQQYFVHLVQRQGQEGDPLLTLDLPAGDRQQVFLDLIYPADSTPPQVLTVRTE